MTPAGRPRRADAEQDVVAQTERWFVRSGLPYFVPAERAAAREALQPRRTAPWLALTVVTAVAAAGLLLWLSGDVSLAPSTLTFVGLGAALAYAVTKLRARPILAFAASRTASGFRSLLPMVTRALPLLLVFITFLFINAEVWILSANLDGGVLWLTVLLFAAIAIGFLMVRIPEEVDGVDDRIDRALLLSASRGTPLADEAQALVDRADDDLDLQAAAQVRGYERANLIAVLLVIQLSQILLLALAVLVFFLVFGALTTTEQVQNAWVAGVGGDVHHLPYLDSVSVELLQVSVFLAAFSGLYFTVYVVTDETYRAQFFTGVLAELERAVAVRLVYRELVGAREDGHERPLDEVSDADREAVRDEQEGRDLQP